MLYTAKYMCCTVGCISLLIRKLLRWFQVVYGADHGTHESPTGEPSTQARADIEIEKHFEEEVL